MRAAVLSLLLIAALILAPAVPGGAATARRAAPKPVVKAVPVDPIVARLSALNGKDFDVAYMRELIPINEEAVEIAYAATLNANHPELLQWNQVMIDRKAKQTGTMLGVLQTMGVPPGKRNVNVVTDRVKKMRSLQGEALEKTYMPLVITHFGQSIAISKLALTKAADQRVKDVAALLVRVETRETEQLRGWLKTWYKM